MDLQSVPAIDTLTVLNSSLLSMRLLPVLLLVAGSLSALSGCDSALDTVPDILVVTTVRGIESGYGVQLQTEGDYPCGAQLDVRAVDEPGRLDLDVRGVRMPSVNCRALDAPLTFTANLPEFVDGSLDLQITHRGVTDRYRVFIGFAGVGLETLSAEVTRPGP